MGRRGDWVIPHETQRLSDLYDVGEELGYGRYGTTYLCVEKSTGARHACKSIEKGKLPRRKHYESVWREIKVMHHLSEQEAVVGIRGAYEDDTSVHIVMELCSGGELYHGILKKGHYTERKAARLIRIIVGMVEACHSLGVMHRDLKPENFLFVGEDDDHSALKAIDFGLSIFFQPGNIYKDVVGSPYYVAPEVLRKSYGPEVDIWSAGVILYILLCGVPPFWGEAEPEIFEQVLFGPLDFESEPWPRVSESAKDLIRNMLNRNPTKRFTAHEVLSHPWMAVDDNVAPDRPLDPAVFSRLKRFSPMNRLKKMALRVMAERLAEEEIGGLKELFKTLDTENSGSITFEELKRGLQRVGSHLTESEIRALVDGVDMNGSGAIDHVEFIAATLHANKIEEEQNLISAFYFFDRDRSGYITIDQLQRACREMDLHDAHLHELIREIDQNNDGKVDYGEFAAMMRSNDRGERGRRKKNGNND